MAESLFRQTQKRRLELPKETPGRKKRKSNENPSEDDSDADRPTSPTSRCPICLLVLNNRSYTDTCLHEFCFQCIKQWSEIKHECPLCKQTFHMIMHSVRALDDYKEYPLPPLDPPTPPYGSGGGEGRVSLQIENSSNLNLHFSLAMVGVPSESLFRSLPTTRRRPPRVQYSLAADRAMIYMRNLWVRENQQLGYRLSSPGFYRRNEAMTHRLCVWLSREVRVLVALDGAPDRRTSTSLDPNQSVQLLGPGGTEPLSVEDYVNVIVNRILEHIRQYPIRHQRMLTLAKFYFGAYAHHFVHEFYSFAVSAYDMIGYDREAQYVSQNMMQLYVDLTSPGAPGPSTSAAPEARALDLSEYRRDIEILDEVSVEDSPPTSERRRPEATPPVSLSTNEVPRPRRGRSRGSGGEDDSSDDVICISPPPAEIIELSTDDETEGAARAPPGSSTAMARAIATAHSLYPDLVPDPRHETHNPPPPRSVPSFLAHLNAQLGGRSRYRAQHDDEDVLDDDDDADDVYEPSDQCESVESDVDEDYVPPGGRGSRHQTSRRRTRLIPSPGDSSDGEVVRKKAASSSSSAKRKASKKDSSKASSSKSGSSKASTSKGSSSKASTSKDSSSKSSTSKASSSKSSTSKSSSSKAAVSSKKSSAKGSVTLSSSKASTSKDPSSKSSSKDVSSRNPPASSSQDQSSKPSSSKDSSTKSSSKHLSSKESSSKDTSSSRDLSTKACSSKDTSSSKDVSTKAASSKGPSTSGKADVPSMSRRGKPTMKRDVTADPATILAAGFPSLRGGDLSGEGRSGAAGWGRQRRAKELLKAKRDQAGARNPVGRQLSSSHHPDDVTHPQSSLTSESSPERDGTDSRQEKRPANYSDSSQDEAVSSSQRSVEKKASANHQGWSVLKSKNRVTTSSDTEEDARESTKKTRHAHEARESRQCKRKRRGASCTRDNTARVVNTGEHGSQRPTSSTRDNTARVVNTGEHESQRPTRRCKNMLPHFFPSDDSDDESSESGGSESALVSCVRAESNVSRSKKVSDESPSAAGFGLGGAKKWKSESPAACERRSDSSVSPGASVTNNQRASVNENSSDVDSEEVLDRFQKKYHKSVSRSDKSKAKVSEATSSSEDNGHSNSREVSKQMQLKNKRESNGNRRLIETERDTKVVSRSDTEESGESDTCSIEDKTLLQRCSNTKNVSMMEKGSAQMSAGKMKKVRRRRKKKKKKLSESKEGEARRGQDVKKRWTVPSVVKEKPTPLERSQLSESSSDETEDKNEEEEEDRSEENCGLGNWEEHEDSDSENGRDKKLDVRGVVGSNQQSGEKQQRGQASGDTRVKSAKSSGGCRSVDSTAESSGGGRSVDSTAESSGGGRSVDSTAESSGGGRSVDSTAESSGGCRSVASTAESSGGGRSVDSTAESSGGCRSVASTAESSGGGRSVDSTAESSGGCRSVDSTAESSGGCRSVASTAESSGGCRSVDSTAESSGGCRSVDSTAESSGGCRSVDSTAESSGGCRGVASTAESSGGGRRVDSTAESTGGCRSVASTAESSGAPRGHILEAAGERGNDCSRNDNSVSLRGVLESRSGVENVIENIQSVGNDGTNEHIVHVDEHIIDVVEHIVDEVEHIVDVEKHRTDEHVTVMHETSATEKPRRESCESIICDESSSSVPRQDVSGSLNRCERGAFGNERKSLGERLLNLQANLAGKDARMLYRYFLSESCVESVENLLNSEKTLREPFSLKIFQTLPGIQSLASFLTENADEFDELSSKSYKETLNPLLPSDQPSCSNYSGKSLTLVKRAGETSAQTDIATLRTLTAGLTDVYTLRCLKKEIAGIDSQRARNRVLAGIATVRALSKEIDLYVAVNKSPSVASSRRKIEAKQSSPTSQKIRPRNQSCEENENEEYIRNLSLVEKDYDGERKESSENVCVDVEPENETPPETRALLSDLVVGNNEKIEIPKKDISSRQHRSKLNPLGNTNKSTVALTASTSRSEGHEAVVVVDEDVFAMDDDVIPFEDSSCDNRKRPPEVLVLSSDDEVKRPPVSLVSGRQGVYQHKKFSQARKSNPVVHDVDSDEEDINVVGEVKQGVARSHEQRAAQNRTFHPTVSAAKVRRGHDEFPTQSGSTSRATQDSGAATRHKSEDEIIDVDTVDCGESLPEDMKEAVRSFREEAASKLCRQGDGEKLREEEANPKKQPVCRTSRNKSRDSRVMNLDACADTCDVNVNDLDDIQVDFNDPIFHKPQSKAYPNDGEAPTCSRYVRDNQVTIRNQTCSERKSAHDPEYYGSKRSRSNRKDSEYLKESDADKHMTDDSLIVVDDAPSASRGSKVINVDSLDEDENAIICVESVDTVQSSEAKQETGNEIPGNHITETGDDVINVIDDDVTASIPPASIPVLNHSRRENLPQAWSPTIDLEKEEDSDSEGSDETTPGGAHKDAATKKYVQNILKFNQMWKGRHQQLWKGRERSQGADASSSGRENTTIHESSRRRHDNMLKNQQPARCYTEASPVPTPARYEASPVPTPARYEASPVPTPARYEASPVPTPARYDDASNAFDSSSSHVAFADAWPKYTIYENRTKHVTATLCGPHRAADVPAQRGGRIMEITTQETYDVVKICHEKSDGRKRLVGPTESTGGGQGFLGSGSRVDSGDRSRDKRLLSLDSSLLSRADTTRAHRKSESHCPYPPALLSNPPPHYFRTSHPTARQSDPAGRMGEFKHGAKVRDVSCLNTRGSAPVAMETYPQADELYPGYGSYYTPMDPRYLTYFAGYTGGLGDSLHKTEEKSPPQATVVKYESDSCSDVNVEDDDDRRAAQHGTSEHRLRVKTESSPGSVSTPASRSEHNETPGCSKESKHRRRHSNQSRDRCGDSETGYQGNTSKHSGNHDNDPCSTSHSSRSSKLSHCRHGNKSKQSSPHGNTSESDTQSKSKESSLCRSISSSQSKHSKHSRSSKSSHKSKSRSHSKSKHKVKSSSKSKSSHRTKSSSRSKSSHKSTRTCKSKHSAARRASHRRKHKKSYSSDSESDAGSTTCLKKSSSDAESDSRSHQHAGKCSPSDSKCDSSSSKSSRKKRHKGDVECESGSNSTSRRSKKKSKRSYVSSSED